MSTRALRKIEKEREKARLEPQTQHDRDQDESADEQEDTAPPKTQSSLFAVLNDAVGEDDDSEEESQEPNTADQDNSQEDNEPRIDTKTTAASPLTSSAKRKRKQKKRKHQMPASTPSTSNKQDNVDDIDAILDALSIGGQMPNEASGVNAVDLRTTKLCRLLSVDVHHLLVANEMKRLFGRAAIEAEEEERKAQKLKQIHRQGDTISMAEAVTGQHSRGGAGLAAVIRRRNIFIQGKEEWPKATGGGLGMEIIAQQPGGIVEYAFVHNKIYQSTQQEFEACVAMMDPQLMVNLVRYHPYHISTLLQVSEIAKQDRDPATAGELLERALFSFGRCLHSSFSSKLAQGKARLDFNRPENREFWLAATRYIRNITMKATWRTALEWCKVVLSLDPDNDPYCMRLMIDQLAIRSRQFQYLIELCDADVFKDEPSINTYYSRSLAIRGTGKSEEQASEVLSEAIRRYPWAAARLLKELDVQKIPPAVWGSEPAYDVEKLHSELYVAQAKDIWRTPDALSFLTKVCQAISPSTIHAVHSYRDITADEARYVFLLDQPALIGLLPRALTEKINSMSDPLPPENNLRSYTIEQPELRTSRAMQGDFRNNPEVARMIEEYERDPERFLRELQEREDEENGPEASEDGSDLD